MNRRTRVLAVFLVLVGIFAGYFDYASERGTGVFAEFPFSLGLDLKGGTHLVYEADLNSVASEDTNDSLDALRAVIERRVNIFGVSEPLVQTSKKDGSDGKTDGRLIVELPGVTDIAEATKLIGATPVLDFRTENPAIDRNTVSFDEATGELTNNGLVIDPDTLYVPTELSGAYLKRAIVAFNQISGVPMVSLQFNNEGADLFRELTKENVGKTMAIYLDGSPISAPVVEEEISGGQAQITGGFTIDEAKILAERLNSGALPVPIQLISTQTIGASLGEEAVERGVKAGIIGFLLISLFFVFWYRLPGIFAVVSLMFYLMAMLALFKLIPVTLTAAGIAGFILSLGLAVDANVLIFERLKEELVRKANLTDAINEAFSRAWASIRDGNLTGIITAVILFWFGTSLLKGFALTLGLGILVSLFSANILTRATMLSFGFKKAGKMLGSGFSFSKKEN